MANLNVHQAVARATGESVHRIARMGFSEIIVTRPNYARMRQAILARRAKRPQSQPSARPMAQSNGH